jgi:aryl-alcohol dehydrogenase-like predicted oxidoreductase
MGHWMTNEVLEAVEHLSPIAAEAGLSVAQLALAWVLGGPSVASALIGATRPAQIEENVVASTKEIGAAQRRAIDDVLREVVRWSEDDDARLLARTPLGRL